MQVALWHNSQNSMTGAPQIRNLYKLSMLQIQIALLKYYMTDTLKLTNFDELQKITKS